jgi:prophage DNA circulation protein
VASDIISQLREFKWKGIGFPVSQTRVSLAHDQVEHKYWGQDGARVEATGRAPIVITARIHYRNNLAKAKNETWGVLYPETYRKSLVAAAETSTGTLEHPELGDIRCKLKTFDQVWDATIRDGIDVEATWVETREDDLDAVILTDQSPVAEAFLAAFDLDEGLATLSPPLGTGATYKPDFTDTIRSIVAVADQVSLLSKQSAGRVNALLYRIGQIEFAANGAKSALLWPISTSCQRMRSSVYKLQQKLLQKQQSISFYRVPRTLSLSSLALDMPGNTIADLIKLNPDLPSKPAVEAGTLVRYYKI